MNCNKCGTANDDGSKYCKECGQRLADPGRTAQISADQHLKIGEFVYHAYKESEAGNLDKAIEACQGALAINDANHATHALLGSIYERKGDLARAIYEYERVVSLNPGSLDDRRKLEQLRARLLSPTPVAAPSARPSFRLSDVKWLRDPRVLPWIASVATFVIVVVVVGSLLLRGGSGKQSAPEMHGRHTATGPTQGVPGQPVPYGQGGYNPVQPGMAQQHGAPNAAGRVDDAEERNAASPSAPSNRQTRPGIAPVPLPGTAPRQSASQPAKPSTNEEPVIVPIPRPRPDAGPSGTAPANSVTTASPSNTVTIQPGKSPEQRGIDLHRMGRYDDAIGAYREALNQTSDPGRVYQNMAMSYQRKGEHDAAIDSYNRAIKAYRDQLTSGRSRAEVESGIRACEAGIEVSRNQK